jgi:hypothetical protein
VLNEEVVDDVVAEVAMSGVVADEAMKICRSAWLQGVWQSHPRHADLREVSDV